MKNASALRLFLLSACLGAASCLGSQPPVTTTPPAGENLAAEFDKAEKAFEKGVFQEALGSYEKVWKGSNDPALRHKSFFRVCESLTHLFRYGEAAKLLFETPLPEAAPESARVLLLKAGLTRSFIMQYGYLLDRNEASGAEEASGAAEGSGDPNTVFRLTRKQVEDEIAACYRELVKMRETLKGMILADEGYFFATKDVDVGMFPTLYDFFVQQWSDYLLAGQTLSETDLDVIVGDRRMHTALASRVFKAADLMESASSFMADKFPESAEYWRVKRLAIVLKLGWNALDAEKAEAMRVKAAAGFTGLMESLSQAGPRAYAGYQAALIENQRGKYVSARELCERVIADWPDAPAAKNAKALRFQIVNPYLYFSAENMTRRDQKKLSTVTRNLPQVYFRAFRLKSDVLSRLEAAPSLLSQLADGDLRDDLSKLVLSRGPDLQWTAATDDPGRHEYVSLTSRPPALSEGIYLILACHDDSFTIGNSLLSSVLVNVTDLVLVESRGVSLKSRAAYYDFLYNKGAGEVKDSVFRYYVLDAASGKPVDRASVFVGWRRDSSNGQRGSSGWQRAALGTSRNGSAPLELDVTARPQDHDNFGAFPLAKRGDAYSYLQYPAYFWQAPPPALEFFIETDRPIYRPGDKLAARIAGVRRTSDGWRALNKDYSVTVRARDPNRNVMFERTLPLSAAGSADFEFEIPKGKLLGQYSLEASAARGNFTGAATAWFQVEEYKRPEFEIVFDKIDKPLRFNETAGISGTVKYYFGGAAANADVSYTVSRSFYLPWYYRSWLSGGYDESARELASGKIKTDDAGKFRVTFTPRLEDVELPAWLRNGLAPEIAEYSISVDARDSGGRTISGSTTAKAGKSDRYFTVEPGKGFFFEKEKPAFTANSLSINDQPVAGAAEYEVHLLKDPPLRTLEELGWGASRSGAVNSHLPGLDFQLKDAENLKLAARGKLTFGADGKSSLSLPALEPGAYRLIMNGRDSANAPVTQRKVFLVVNERGAEIPVNLASVTLFEHEEYKTGDTARLVIGSRFIEGVSAVELWAGRYFIGNLVLDTSRPVQAVTIPVTADMKGGFSVRWFGVRDLAVHSGEASALVPWNEKKLSVALEPFTEKLAPGEKAEWGVKTKDASGKPVPGEVLVFMYDRSLEYYSRTRGRSFGSLYFPNPRPEVGGHSDFRPYTQTQSLREGPLYNQLYIDTRIAGDVFPGFRTDRTWIRRGYLNRMDGGGEGDDMLYDAVPAPMVSEVKSVRQSEATAAADRDGRSKEKDRFDGEGAPMPSVEARKAFADTAFFLPRVATDKNGSARFSFTAPEQLTGWKVRAIAFTNEVAWGELDKEAVTKKDLMVRLDLPRFFREKDKGTVTIVAHNESDKPMTGQVWIDVIEEGASILAKIKLSGPNKPFTIPAHGLQSFDWAVEIPTGIGAWTVRAVAKTSQLSDAEERTLPILPSRQRLIESAFALIKGSEVKAISIPAGLDPTRIDESVTLEIDPQLTLSLLNTLPFLIDYPYSCVEQSLNKYVPLAIVNEIYGKYPEVRKAVAKIPKRSTVTPPWEEKNPLRQLTIDETPWGWQAKGRPSIYPVIDLLDPAIVAAQKESVFADLKAAQLSSGAFPWWPGGREDLYMTLYVLSGLAEALRYGVAADKDMVNRALSYVNAVVPKSFKPEPYQLAIVAYAAYVVTGFPVKDFAEAAKSRELVKGWLDFLYEHRFALTPFGKGYLAHVYFRLEDKAKGEEILAMALDGAREDPIAGLYWTPESYSWVWYSDTVEKHAFFLKTLIEFKPDDRRIEGMVRWLLWNRKGNVWKSTKASAAALYSLLDFLKKGGSLLADEKYTVDWGKTKTDLAVKGDEWQEKPLRLIRPETDSGSGGPQAVITKEGPGTSIGSLTWIYSTDQLPTASGPGLIELKRQFFIRVKEGSEYRLREIKSGDTAAVGDQIEVKITITTKSQFEYLHLKDPKAAGFEAETLLSGWKYDPLWFYEEPRDSGTNFFFGWVPHGEYVLRYRLRPTKPGEYRVGAATLQSMYAPDLNAHSDGFVIKVKK